MYKTNFHAATLSISRSYFNRKRFSFSFLLKKMCSIHSKFSFSMHILCLFGVFFAVGCGLSSPKYVDFFRMQHPMTCVTDDLIPVLKVTWDESKFEVSQVLEATSITRYFLLSQEPNMRSNAVAYISTKNVPSFNFSLTGNLLNQPVEFYLDHMLENTKGLFHSTKCATQLCFGLKNTVNNQPVFEKSETPAFLWNSVFRYVTQGATFMNGTLSTNCNLFEPNSKPICIFKLILNLPAYQLFWIAEGNIHRSSDSVKLSARLIGGASHQSKGHLFLNANWSTSQETFKFSSDLVLDGQSLVALTISSSSFSGLQLNVELVSLAFDWRFFSNWNVKPKEDGRVVTGIAEGNYLFRPSAMPIRYQFGLSESNSSSRVFILWHNVSSALYRFEGNMTVDVQPTDSEPDIFTKITQKIRTSSLERPLRLDLQQVFHQSGHWTWETVVLRSGLFDMHVSGHWNDTIFDQYRKLFQIHSHDQECFPSMNLKVNYSDRLRFYHQVSYPFLAFSYGLLVQFSNPSSLIPAEVRILYRDEFKTNHSRSILQLKLSEVNSIFNAEVSIDWLEINRMVGALKNHQDKLTVWMADEQHPINQLLKPILGRPTLASSFADALKWLKNFS